MLTSTLLKACQLLSRRLGGMASSSVIAGTVHEDSIRPNRPHSTQPPSLNIGEDQEAMTEVVLPFHGSCSKCHHLHTNRPFRYFLTIKKHLRFKCEHCHRDMFGLGNDSTQTTLASQETISPRSSWPLNMSRASITDLEPTRLARQSQDLGTIVENNSLDGRSVNGSHRSALSLVPERAAEAAEGDASRPQSVTVISPSIAGGSITNARASDETLDCDHQPQRAIPPRRFRKWKNKITRWIGRWRGTKIEVTFPMHQGYPTLKVSREPSSENPNRSVCRGTQSHLPQTEQARTMLGISQTRPSQGTPSVPIADEAHSRDEEHAAEPSNGDGEIMEDEPSVRAAKRERVKAQRREKTERIRAMENPDCQCLQDCQCRQPTHSSSFGSRSRRHSISTSDVPSHSLGHIWGDAEGDTDPGFPHRHVAFIGAGAWMHASATSNHRHRSGNSDSWESQATTAVSNESSISLEGARPATRRSHSLPPIRQLLDRHGPVIRDALRDDTVHSQFQDLARQARNSDSPPVTQDSTRVNSGITVATETGSSHDDTDGTMPPHASSTSLANLAAPDSDGELDHRFSGDSSAHPSPTITLAPEPPTEEMEASSMSLNDGLPDGVPNTSPETGPEPVTIELNHVSDGTSTPSTLRHASQHRTTSSLTDHIPQSAAREEHDSTPVS